MIIRDSYGIVMQHDRVTGKLDSASAGDSAARTGPLAVAGSYLDMQNLKLFVTVDRRIVRHPYDVGFNSPVDTSRDNVVQWAVGVQEDDVISQAAVLNYARLGWVNKDYLSPSVRLYLYKQARAKAPLWIRLLAPLDRAVALLWNTKVRPWEEQNQFICLLSKESAIWTKAYLALHPNVRAALMDYWNNWRNQPEIAEAFIKILKEPK